MSTPPTAKRARPLSPHLQVYRPQLTSMLSILHRASGVGLALGLPVLVAWLVALAGEKPFFDMFTGLFQNPVGQVLLFGWSWAFFYHACAGIRHLLWDAGYFLGIKNVYRTGWLAFGVSALITGYAWFNIEDGDWQALGLITLQFLGALLALAIVAGILLWIMAQIPRTVKKTASMRSPLAGVRGLGAAKQGTAHWWALRITSLALVILSLYLVLIFFDYGIYGDYDMATTWFASPFIAVLMILFLGVAFHHAANGVQVVIEDYVHGEAIKLTSIMAVKFIAVAFTLLGSISLLKILFFAIITAMQPNAPTQQ